MPTIMVNMFEGRSLDQKRKLVAAMTEAVVQSLGVKPEAVRIFLKEMARENHAVGGVLTSDMKGG
jgi:4-oxalocrotonate tautomerase